MSEPFISEIRMVGFNFPPNGWARCDGQLLPISQNDALFALIGTMYGGNGQTTFALPDLRGRVPIHVGQGPGLTPRTQGAPVGSDSVQLTQNQMPAHNHTIRSADAPADSPDPTVRALGVARKLMYSQESGTATLHENTLSTAGGGGSHPNVQPYTAINFVIALFGIFPSQF